MAKPENPIQLAVIGAAHGIKGEVRVRVFTDDPTALADYGTLYTVDGRALNVAALRPAKNVVVVRFREIAGRDAAEALNGTALFVDRSVLPRDLEEDEYYHADLVGLTVLDETGGKVGRIVAVHDFGAGDMLEVALPSGRTAMAPFTKAAVPVIDVVKGEVRIDSAAAGLDGAADDAADPTDDDDGQTPHGSKTAGGGR